jgi:hypothetical protein
MAPLLKYFDFFQIMNRHYFAPRATTWRSYTVASQVVGGTCPKCSLWVVKCLIYDLLSSRLSLLCSIHAVDCALIFMIQFWMDKFLLLVSLSWFISQLSHTKANLSRLSLTVLQRSWSKAPRLGTETARFSRKYFTTIAVVLGSISSAYAYFQSPFTQLCDCSEDESCAVSDTSFQDVLLLNGTTISSIETSSNQAVKFYNHYIRPFPPVPDRQGPVFWMDDG